jgi:hypothetical protein
MPAGAKVITGAKEDDPHFPDINNATTEGRVIDIR